VTFFCKLYNTIVTLFRARGARARQNLRDIGHHDYSTVLESPTLSQSRGQPYEQRPAIGVRDRGEGRRGGGGGP
jgi:hypothetical protein